METKECAQLLCSFQEDELAAILACMTEPTRAALMKELQAVNAHLAECAFDTMR